MSVVVVTGVGVVSPIGVGRGEFWSALCAGESGIGLVERAGRAEMVAAAREFVAKDFIRSPHLRRMDRMSRMIVAASRMALDDAGLVREAIADDGLGIVVGSVLGDISESATYLARVFLKGAAAASPMVFPNLVLNAPASYAAMELGATGINLTVAQNEICGEQAIIEGAAMVRAGRAEVVLAGGGDELADIVGDIYRQGRLLSGQRGGPQWCSPYDAARNGLVLGEGAAMLALESRDRALARGAAIIAEIEADAIFSVPSSRFDWPRRAGAALAPLCRALAGQSVELICGGANSTRALDACELDLFAQLGGAEVSVTSIKGAIGEFGAAGALSAAAACLALREQVVPPLCHLQTPAAHAGLHLAAQRGEARPLQRALLCGLARGGAGAALVLRAPSFSNRG